MYVLTKNSSPVVVSRARRAAWNEPHTTGATHSNVRRWLGCSSCTPAPVITEDSKTMPLMSPFGNRSDWLPR